MLSSASDDPQAGGEPLDRVQGRKLTQEDYEDLEATVRKHHDYLEGIVQILREQEEDIRRLQRGDPPPGVNRGIGPAKY